MEIFARIEIAEVVSTIFYTGFGVGLMILCWIVIEALTPFSLRREIEEDHNIAVAIIMSAVFLSLAILIAAVITS